VEDVVAFRKAGEYIFPAFVVLAQCNEVNNVPCICPSTLPVGQAVFRVNRAFGLIFALSPGLAAFRFFGACQLNGMG
jgi:hypothetical protein